MIKKGEETKMEKFIKRELLSKKDLELVKQREMFLGVHFDAVAEEWLKKERKIKKEE